MAAKLAIAAPRGYARSNVEMVAEALREAIVDGRLAPGERLKETPLSEQLGVSRGPIREAIRLLEHDGLLSVVTNRGATVPVATATDVLEVYAMRSALGSLALHKLLLTAPSPSLGHLDRQLERFKGAVARGDARQAADADLAYQSAVVAAAGLPRVDRQWRQLTWQVRIFISSLGFRFDGKLTTMLAEVHALHAAITAGDDAAAERLWREKFERWVGDFAEQMGEGFDAEVWGALTAGTASTAGRA